MSKLEVVHGIIPISSQVRCDRTQHQLTSYPVRDRRKLRPQAGFTYYKNSANPFHIHSESIVSVNVVALYDVEYAYMNHSHFLQTPPYVLLGWGRLDAPIECNPLPNHATPAGHMHPPLEPPLPRQPGSPYAKPPPWHRCTPPPERSLHDHTRGAERKRLMESISGSKKALRAN
jgi:hypothetical protein